MLRELGVAGVLLAAAACHDHGPAAPTSVALVMTPTALTVPRNGTVSIMVQVQRSNGALEDVTTAAAWTSSAPDVVTVQAGVVKAVSIGTAIVTANYDGLKGTVNVVARRNTRLTGPIVIEDVRGWYSMHTIAAYLDDRVVWSRSFSGGQARYTVPLGDPQSVGNDTSVAPGVVRLAVRLTPTTSFEVTWLSRPESYVEVRDLDTDEVLDRMPLGVQTVVKPAVSGATGEFFWTLTIDVFH